MNFSDLNVFVANFVEETKNQALDELEKKSKANSMRTRSMSNNEQRRTSIFDSKTARSSLPSTKIDWICREIRPVSSPIRYSFSLHQQKIFHEQFFDNFIENVKRQAIEIILQSIVENFSRQLTENLFQDALLKISTIPTSSSNRIQNLIDHFSQEIFSSSIDELRKFENNFLFSRIWFQRKFLSFFLQNFSSRIGRNFNDRNEMNFSLKSFQSTEFNSIDSLRLQTVKTNQCQISEHENEHYHQTFQSTFYSFRTDADKNWITQCHSIFLHNRVLRVLFIIIILMIKYFTETKTENAFQDHSLLQFVLSLFVLCQHFSAAIGSTFFFL